MDVLIFLLILFYLFIYTFYEMALNFHILSTSLFQTIYTSNHHNFRKLSKKYQFLINFPTKAYKTKRNNNEIDI